MPLAILDLRPHFLTFDDAKIYCGDDGRLNFVQLFGNTNPVELDVGCGRGMFLFNASTTQPERNFLGLELDFTEGRRGAKRLFKLNQPNARVIGGDVNYLLEHVLQPGSLSAVHVYFPDPWWKRKHRRRRLFTDQFADRVARALQTDGSLHFWSDVDDYFTDVSSLLDHHAEFVRGPTPTERPVAHHLDYHTSFERTRRLAGLPIYRGLWQRRGLP